MGLASPREYDDEPLAALAYDLSLRGLGQQEAALAELRARTGTLLTAASLLVAFLGALAIDRQGLDLLAASALAAYALSGGLSVWILVPKRDLILRLSGPELYEREYGLGLSEVHRRLAYWIEGYAVRNQLAIGRLQTAFRLAAIALLVEALLWGLHLSGTI